jgi:putative membrane protein
MQILPLINTSCIAISAVLVAIGWFQIVRGNKEVHKRFMLSGAFFALLFFILYMYKTIFVGSTQFGGPDHLKIAYLIFLLFHIVLSTVSAVFGVVTIWLAFKERFVTHRRIGRVTATIWLLTAATGVTVYVMLHVLYPGGEVGGLIDAIW